MQRFIATLSAIVLALALAAGGARAMGVAEMSAHQGHQGHAGHAAMVLHHQVQHDAGQAHAPWQQALDGLACKAMCLGLALEAPDGPDIGPQPRRVLPAALALQAGLQPLAGPDPAEHPPKSWV